MNKIQAFIVTKPWGNPYFEVWTSVDGLPPYCHSTHNTLEDAVRQTATLMGCAVMLSAVPATFVS